MMGLPTSYHLTDEWIASLPVPDKETLIHDTECEVLAVRCRPNGSKAFYLFGYEWDNASEPYRERQFRRPIGSTRKLTCFEARMIARKAIDAPWILDRGKRVSPCATLPDVIESYLSEAVSGERRKSFSEETAERRTIYLIRHLEPLLGQRRLSALSRTELMEYFERLNYVSPSEAYHAHKAAKAFLYWCAEVGVVPSNPLAKSNLKNLSARKAVSLPLEDIANIYLACCRMDHVSARLVRFTILAACDIKKARLAQERDIMRWPDLPPLASSIARKSIGSPWCFPSPRRSDQPVNISTEFMAKLLAESDLRKDWKARDLIRSVKQHRNEYKSLTLWEQEIERRCAELLEDDVVI